MTLKAVDYGVPQRRQRYFILATKDQNVELSIPKPSCKEEVTVEEALMGLTNVIPNSNVEATEYMDEESEYSKKMKDAKFWHREKVQRLTYQMPMKHREYTLKRFSLLNQGESLKDLFDKYTGKERDVLPAVENVSHGIPEVTKSTPSSGIYGKICSAVTSLISECITCTSG